MDIVFEDKPDWAVGSPPCTDLCMLSVCINFPKMDDAVVKKRIAQATKHVAFMKKNYLHQIRNE